jgi:EAL domain-containing protein (putative c-di-GMP-specific phosphodiesterase class I)
VAKILILDDNPFVCKVIRQQLLNLGVAAVYMAHRAVDALSLMKDDKLLIDLVICDLKMPEKDGIEFLKELHEVNESVAVAILSGADESILSAAGDVAEQYGFNVIGRLAKPASPKDLRGLLQRLVPGPSRAKSRSSITVSEEQIRQAIEQRELICYYQPLVDVKTGTPIGVEALARWQTKEGEFIPPGVFIPIAEKSDIIVPLTDLLFELAIEDYLFLESSGIEPYLAFNLSNRVLDQKALPAALAKSCQQADIGPNKIILEITETCLEADETSLLEVATRFRLKLFRLAIDDFGTGFSSLERLARLPFSELKIDCSFLWDARENAKSAEILISTCRMARALGLKTVAEGVEEVRDWDLVKRAGVDTGQGYYYSKPLPRDDLLQWWRSQ